MAGVHRRAVLSAAGVAVAPLAGCLSTDAGDAVVSTAEQSAADDATAISYTDLPEAEQQTARTAVEEASYHACPDLSDALYSFSEQLSTIDNSHLAYQGVTYGLWIRIQDTVTVAYCIDDTQIRRVTRVGLTPYTGLSSRENGTLIAC